MPAKADLEGDLLKDLGPAGAEAARIVEAYVLGARARHGGSENPPAEFIAGLDLILNGLGQQLKMDAAPAAKASSQTMVQSELWQMLRVIRESAEIAYTRELDLIELDRRILLLLHAAGPLVPADISSAVGVDKAQVSRSVKRLLEQDMLTRSQIRSPLNLTEHGDKLTRRLLRLADLRNRELTFDIDEGDLGHFYDCVELLLSRAMLLYDQERELAHGEAEADPSPAKAGPFARSGDGLVIDRTRIVSPLMTLSAYFSRSGALAFKRLTGLSTFEAFVLSEIGMQPPIEWPRLVRALGRDHSQAGRTVNALVDRGLVLRQGKPGRRHGQFLPSATGAVLFDIIHQAGRDRSAFLMQPLDEGRRARFFRTFGKVRKNAEAQLQRERTFAELDRS